MEMDWNANRRRLPFERNQFSEIGDWLNFNVGDIKRLRDKLYRVGENGFKQPIEFGERAQRDYLKHLSGRSNEEAFNLTYTAYSRYFGKV